MNRDVVLLSTLRCCARGYAARAPGTVPLSRGSDSPSTSTCRLYSAMCSRWPCAAVPSPTLCAMSSSRSVIGCHTKSQRGRMRNTGKKTKKGKSCPSACKRSCAHGFYRQHRQRALTRIRTTVCMAFTKTLNIDRNSARRTTRLRLAAADSSPPRFLPASPFPPLSHNKGLHLQHGRHHPPAERRVAPRRRNLRRPSLHRRGRGNAHDVGAEPARARQDAPGGAQDGAQHQCVRGLADLLPTEKEKRERKT